MSSLSEKIYCCRQPELAATYLPIFPGITPLASIEQKIKTTKDEDIPINPTLEDLQLLQAYVYNMFIPFLFAVLALKSCGIAK